MNGASVSSLQAETAERRRSSRRGAWNTRIPKRLVTRMQPVTGSMQGIAVGTRRVCTRGRREMQDEGMGDAGMRRRGTTPVDGVRAARRRLHCVRRHPERAPDPERAPRPCIPSERSESSERHSVSRHWPPCMSWSSHGVHRVNCEHTEGTGSTYGGNWEYPEGTERAERGTFRVEDLAPTHRSSPATTPTLVSAVRRRDPSAWLCVLHGPASVADRAHPLPLRVNTQRDRANAGGPRTEQPDRGAIPA